MELAKIQAEIVHSHEESTSRLEELKEKKKLKLEERDTLQESIQEKKHSIMQIKEKLDFVQKMTKKFSTLRNTNEELTFVFIIYT